MASPAVALDLGRRPYREVLEFQRVLHDRIASGDDAYPEGGVWLVVEHDPVITLGRAAKEENLLLPRPLLEAQGVDVVAVERGGDVTYHGPGQLVIYPIRKLAKFREIVPVVSALENAVIDTLRRFGIESHRRHEHRGVYVGRDNICAVGLAVRRMTTMHGLALNVSTPLDYDRLITPCGMLEFGITSLSAQLGRPVGLGGTRDTLLDALEGAFTVSFERRHVPADAPLPIGAHTLEIAG